MGSANIPNRNREKERDRHRQKQRGGRVRIYYDLPMDDEDYQKKVQRKKQKKEIKGEEG